MSGEGQIPSISGLRLGGRRVVHLLREHMGDDSRILDVHERGAAKSFEGQQLEKRRSLFEADAVRPAKLNTIILAVLTYSWISCRLIAIHHRCSLVNSLGHLECVSHGSRTA